LVPRRAGADGLLLEALAREDDKLMPHKPGVAKSPGAR